jgi:hypothetical protein
LTNNTKHLDLEARRKETEREVREDSRNVCEKESYGISERQFISWGEKA